MEDVMRAVVVVDRGWIFAGDITRKDGRLILKRAVHVLRWESCSFSEMIDNDCAVVKRIKDVDIPEAAEIFCVHVENDWGLKNEE